MKKIIYDTFFLSMFLLAFSVQQPATIAATYIMCALYIFIEKDRFNIDKNIILIYAILTVPCLLAVLNYNHGLTSAFYLFTFPLIFIAAKIMFNKSHDHILLCLRNLYWLFVFGIFVGLALNWENSEPLGAIFPGSSTNGIPSYLIVVQIAFSIAYYLKNCRLPLLSSTVTFVVAIFGIGRGSIIVAALILLFSIFINATSSRLINERKIIFILTGILSLFFGLFLYNNYYELIASVQLLIEGSKFSAGVLDEHRVRMVADYLNKIDGFSLIFGTNYNDTSIVENYGGNPHNSFIRVHSFYGIAGLFYVAIPLFLISISNRRRDQKYITFFLILLTLIRATTEPIFFPSPLDFFYFSYFFIFFNFANRRKRTWSKHLDLYN